MTIEFISNNFPWIFSGIGTTLLGYFFLKKYKNTELTPDINISIHPNDTYKVTTNERKLNYKKHLGQRHKFFREKVLQLTLREMVEFYNLNNVTELEEYEEGINELPLSYLKKLENFFFLNPKYLETGQEPLFMTAHLQSTTIEKYLDMGFSPIIACDPSNRSNLFCYILLEKKEKGFQRILKFDLLSSFASNGSGQLNIFELIHAIINKSIDTYQVRILQANQNIWNKIENNSYYDKETYIGSSDWECKDVFTEWYYSAIKTKNKISK